LLLVICEFPVPSRDAVERRGQTVQAGALEHGNELFVLVGGGGLTIGKLCC
jgi:hypothetical protein